MRCVLCGRSRQDKVSVVIGLVMVESANARHGSGGCCRMM